MPKKKTEQIYKQEEKTLQERGNRYKGKHVMVIADKIFAAKTAREARKLWRVLREKYPDKMPLVTYIPKADSLILCPATIFGRQDFLETFKVTFYKHVTSFINAT